MQRKRNLNITSQFLGGEPSVGADQTAASEDAVRILLLIEASGPVSMRRLIDDAGLSPLALARSVDDFQQDGLVAVDHLDGDDMVSITDLGRRFARYAKA